VLVAFMSALFVAMLVLCIHEVRSAHKCVHEVEDDLESHQEFLRESREQTKDAVDQYNKVVEIQKTAFETEMKKLAEIREGLNKPGDEL